MKITLENNFFNQMESFLSREIYVIQSKNIPTEKIKIYIPNYLVQMYSLHLTGMGFFRESTHSNKFMGVEILDNYNNEVAVCFTDSHLWPDEFKPAILCIPK